MIQSIGTSARGPLAAGLVDYLLPAAILAAALVVLAPMPPAVVDLLLAANLGLAVLALVGAVAARTPLEMSIFPSFLLGATLLRLVLNITTTRLILSRAAVDGAAAAGDVVAAFGQFVAANNLVVGGVIFAIIAVVQFVVITAGSTRTSEVAARFALDGLPGRQMAIDTELQAGTITREQARQQRLELQRQAEFFASMDGASRFVRGEAVASVIITLVNLLGGLAIGVLEHGMPVGKAIGIYSRLTIGDGLCGAIPALFISVATGLLISRSTQAVDLPREFTRQFSARPHVLAIAGGFLAILALTDLPFLPLAGTGAALLGAAVYVGRGGSDSTDQPRPIRRTREPAAADRAVPPAATAAELFAEERLRIEFGRGLVRLVAQDERLLDAVTAVRGRIAGELGFVLPQVKLTDDLSLPDTGFRVGVSGEPPLVGEIPRGRLFAVAAPGAALGLEGPESVDPLGGRQAVWVAHAQAEAARRRGATVFDDVDYVVRTLEAAVRRHADRLLSREDVGRLLESLRQSQPGLVAQTVPEVLSVGRLHRTLQCLLAEGLPIRPLPELLEIMSDHAADAAEPWQLAEILRRRLAGTICRRARDPSGRLTAVRLSAAAVDACAAAAAGGRLPTKLVAEIRRAVRPAVDRGGAAVVVVPGAARRDVRRALVRVLPSVMVLAEEEVADEPGLEVFATLACEEIQRAA
jgi:flagellar biosynthesis protein FlhA